MLGDPRSIRERNRQEKSEDDENVEGRVSGIEQENKVQSCFALL